MQNRTLPAWTIVLVFAVLTGMFCNGLFPFMYLALGTVVAIGLTVAGLVIDLVFKSSKGIRTTGLVFIFFLFATLTSFGGFKISGNAATRLGGTVICL